MRTVTILFLVSLSNGMAQDASFAVAPAHLALAVEPVSLFPTGRYSPDLEAAEIESGRRRWKHSLIAVAASQSLDVASSYGMRELNPLLASGDGRFGAKATSIKFGVTAAVVLVELAIVRKYPKTARLFSKLNWSSSALTTGIAAHNFAVR